MHCEQSKQPVSSRYLQHKINHHKVSTRCCLFQSAHPMYLKDATRIQQQEQPSYRINADSVFTSCCDLQRERLCCTQQPQPGILPGCHLSCCFQTDVGTSLEVGSCYLSFIATSGVASVSAQLDSFFTFLQISELRNAVVTTGAQQMAQMTQHIICAIC